MSNECPEKDKRKKSNWYMYKVMSAYQKLYDTDKEKVEEVQPNDKANDTKSSDSENRKVKWTSTFQTKRIG